MSLPNRDISDLADSLGKRLLVSTALSPIEYAKTLMQIGFEPYPPTQTTTILGKPALGLPNVFIYANYIRSIDGTLGLFNGLTPRICRTIVSTVTHSYFVGEEETDEIKKQKMFPLRLARNIFATSTSIIVSQPFHVVAVRMMAQFIGRETKYTGVFGSLMTIYEEEGFSGWFSGLMPRLFGEVATLFCASSITYVVNTYAVPDDKNFQHVLTVCVEYLVKNLFYPLQVVDVSMAINGSGLSAGSPPLMLNYSGDWMKCWDDLIKSNQAKRGSSLFWRYHSAPKTQRQTIFPPMPEILKLN